MAMPPRVFRVSYYWTTFHHHLGAWNRLLASKSHVRVHVMSLGCLWFFIRSEVTLVSRSVTPTSTADFKLLHIRVEAAPPAFFRRHICLISRSKFCYYDCVKEFLITRIYKHVSCGSLLQLFRSRLRRQQVPSRYYYGKIFVFFFGFDSVEFAKFSHVNVFAS